MVRDIGDILVLGASGFIGSEFTRQALDRGRRVAILQHHRSPDVGIAPLQRHHGSLISFDWESLNSEPPKAIFHFARIPGPGSWGRLTSAVLSALANRRLLNWISRQPSQPLLVLSAGTLAYGPVHGREITEDQPLQPASYARQYHLGERPIVRAAAASKLPIQIIRVPWAYANASWFRSYFLRPMMEQDLIPLYGSGENYMSFIHVADVAGLMMHLAEKAPTGRTYNLFCGKAIRQVEFAGILRNISGLEIQPIPLTGYPKAVAEALSFSLQVASKHRDLYLDYPFEFPDLKTGLGQIWQNRKDLTLHQLLIAGGHPSDHGRDGP